MLDEYKNIYRYKLKNVKVNSISGSPSVKFPFIWYFKQKHPVDLSQIWLLVVVKTARQALYFFIFFSALLFYFFVSPRLRIRDPARRRLQHFSFTLLVFGQLSYPFDKLYPHFPIYISVKKKFIFKYFKL